MPRLSALIFSASLLLAVSCSDGSAPVPSSTPAPVEAAGVVDASTLDMKVMYEYRGHFGCPGDEAGSNGWTGWFEGAAGTQGAGVAYLPDVSSLAAGDLCRTDVSSLDGSAVNLFSSANRRTVDRHFKWMASYGLDGVFLRRAVVEPDDAAMAGFQDRVAENVVSGAEAHGRVFAVMYDLVRAIPGDIVGDWSHVVDDLRLTGSDRYLHHNGRPVLGIDGSGLAHDTNGPGAFLEAVSSIRAASGGGREAALFVVIHVRWQSLAERRWVDLLQAVDYISPSGVGNGDEPAEIGDSLLTHGEAEAAAA